MMHHYGSHLPRRFTGKSRISCAVQMHVQNATKKLSWTILDIMPVGNDRCIHVCQSHGKIKGQEAYSNYVMTDIRFTQDGKIIGLSDFFKDTSVFS